MSSRDIWSDASISLKRRTDSALANTYVAVNKMVEVAVLGLRVKIELMNPSASEEVDGDFNTKLEGL